MQSWEPFTTQVFKYTSANCSDGFRFRVGKFGLVDWYFENLAGYVTVNELRWNVLLNFVWSSGRDVQVFNVDVTCLGEDRVSVEVLWNPRLAFQGESTRKQVSFIAMLFLVNEVQERNGKFQVVVPKTPSVLQTTFSWRGAIVDLRDHELVRNHLYVNLFSEGKEGKLCVQDPDPPATNRPFLLVHDSDRSLKSWRSRIPSSTYITNRTKPVDSVDATNPVLLHVDKVSLVQEVDWDTVYIYTSCLNRMVPLKSKKVVMIDNNNSRYQCNLSLFFLMGVSSEVINLVQNDESNILFFHTLSSVLSDVSDLEVRQVHQLCKS